MKEFGSAGQADRQLVERFEIVGFGRLALRGLEPSRRGQIVSIRQRVDRPLVGQDGLWQVRVDLPFQDRLAVYVRVEVPQDGPASTL